MNRTRIGIAITAAVLAACVAGQSSAYAHGGGTPRLAGEAAGPYLVYAWSEPEPLRAGEVHLTIGVTLPAEGSGASGQDETAVNDADVVVTFASPDRDMEPVVVPAEEQTSLGVVYYEADAVLPGAGSWRVTVEVGGPEGSGAVMFAAEVAAARRVNALALAAAGALVLAFILGLLAVRGRGDSTARQRPATSVREMDRNDAPAPATQQPQG